MFPLAYHSVSSLSVYQLTAPYVSIALIVATASPAQYATSDSTMLGSTGAATVSNTFRFITRQIKAAKTIVVFFSLVMFD